MQRRKFLATVGSIAAGSAAAIGTGAVTSVNADRVVTVETTNDAAAYLSMEGDDDFVTDDSGSGVLHLDLGGPDNPNQYLGSGFNKDAVTEVSDVVTIRNQGTKDLKVTVSDDMANVDVWVGGDNWISPGDTTYLSVEVDTRNGEPSGTVTIDAQN